MPELESYGERFREHRLILNYSPRTVLLHRFYLKWFFRYLREVELSDLAAVTPSHLRDYQIHLHERESSRAGPYSIVTINNAMQTIKSFFRVMKAEGYLVSDPAKEIRLAKKPKRLPRSILGRLEVRKILESPNVNTFLGYRDKAILELLYSTGLRNSEVIHLRMEDLDLEEGYVRVNEGKGAKDRVVPLGKIACRYLGNYIQGVRPKIAEGHLACPFLFLNQYGNRLGCDGLRDLVKAHARRAGIQKRVTPHTFRHTCATHMLKNKANIRHIQELLGHESLETTQIYTAVTVTDLKEAHKKYHPRERERGIV
jgi:integrase/recombinase XerD